jgi:hypothetical protein
MTLHEWMQIARLRVSDVNRMCGAKSPATLHRVVRDPSSAGKLLMRRIYVESLGEVTPNDLLIDDEWRAELARRLNSQQQD